MSWQVVGMEGHVPADTLVAWGAAALSDGQVVLNSLTRRTMSLERAGQLEIEGHWHRFNRPMKLDDDAVEAPLVAVVVNRPSPLKNHFLVTAGRAGGVQAHQASKLWFRYIFTDQSAFDAYATSASVRIAQDVMYSGHETAEDRTRHLSLVRYGLVVAPHDPALNALRVYLTGGAAGAVEALARVSVGSGFALARFERLLAALRSHDETYVLKYRGGNAEAGGFDVDVAIKALDAFGRIKKSLTPAIVLDFPFVLDVPEPRFQTLKAASAEFTFVPSVKGEPLGDRVARYLVLDLAKDALRGEPLHVAADETVLNEAVQVLAQPAPHTHLEQRPMDATELEHVVAREPSVDEEPTRSPVLNVLGFVSGLKKESMIELLIAPPVRLVVSADDDGDGETPRGAESIRTDSSFLRSPCVLSLIREHKSTGAERYWLRKMRLLAPGDTAYVDAAPSAVVGGAFLLGLSLKVAYVGDTLVTDVATLSPVGGHDTDIAHAWLKAYSRAIAATELDHSPRLGWLSPARPREAPALARILIALSDLGGEGPVSKIVARINQRFAVTMSVRTNNTRRLVLQNPELLEFVGANDNRIKWTERGKKYFDVHVAAGGQLRVSADGEDASS